MTNDYLQVKVSGLPSISAVQTLRISWLCWRMEPSMRGAARCRVVQ